MKVVLPFSSTLFENLYFVPSMLDIRIWENMTSLSILPESCDGVTPRWWLDHYSWNNLKLTRSLSLKSKKIWKCFTGILLCASAKSCNMPISHKVLHVHLNECCIILYTLVVSFFRAQKHKKIQMNTSHSTSVFGRSTFTIHASIIKILGSLFSGLVTSIRDC